MRRSAGTIVAGVFFVVMGTLFLLEELEVIDLNARLVWPAALIGLGAAILVGAIPRTHRDE